MKLLVYCGKFLDCTEAHRYQFRHSYSNMETRHPSKFQSNAGEELNLAALQKHAQPSSQGHVGQIVYMVGAADKRWGCIFKVCFVIN